MLLTLASFIPVADEKAASHLIGSSLFVICFTGS